MVIMMKMVMKPSFNEIYVPNFVISYVCVCVCVCAHSCLTLKTVAHQALLSMGFSRQEY